jgi:osmotically-inducible protein OsmY
MRSPTTRRRGARALGLGLALLVAPAAADTQADADTLRRVEERFARAGLDRETGIKITVEDGVVRLKGIALTLPDAREAERAARKEAETVINEIRVFPEQTRSDRDILEDAEKAVTSYARYGVFDAVGLSVDSGVVRVEGFVLDSVRRRQIEDRLARVDGVRDVHNDLRLQGMSQHDERLRLQLHARIYGDPMFARYAGWPNPPVRIFVDRGRATLAGTVGSELERTVLGQIANETLSFGVQNMVHVETAVPEEDRPKDEG